MEKLAVSAFLSVPILRFYHFDHRPRWAQHGSLPWRCRPWWRSPLRMRLRPTAAGCAAGGSRSRRRRCDRGTLASGSRLRPFLWTAPPWWASLAASSSATWSRACRHCCLSSWLTGGPLCPTCPSPVGLGWSRSPQKPHLEKIQDDEGPKVTGSTTRQKMQHGLRV